VEEQVLPGDGMLECDKEGGRGKIACFGAEQRPPPETCRAAG
jgi:hypothetical protein